VAAELPRTSGRQQAVEVEDAAAIIRVGGKVLIVQRPHGGRWGGLWELPRITVPHLGDARKTLQRHVRASLRLAIEAGPGVFSLKHSVTHHRITLTCYESRLLRGKVSPQGYDSCRWVRPDQLADYACSAPQRKAFCFLAAAITASGLPGAP
jgi:adenine-specific DNA glycosylase